jgi:ATP-dependent helicase/nuclease subunit A
LSPVAKDANRRFRRGNLIHALLQMLPDMDAPHQALAAKNFLQLQPDLSETQRTEIAKVSLQVLREPKFADLFGPDSRAELPISGQIEVHGQSTMIHGKIDRLLVRDKDVLVLDFKTNRPPPTRVSQVPASYLQQMATYRALLLQMWPNHQIRCALLWTDGPDLMELPATVLDHTIV